MKRKIIKQRDSYTVTLPIKWVRKNNLKGDEEIAFSEDKNRLVIVPGEYKKPVKEVTIHVPIEENSRIRTIISSAYRRGYDLVTLTADFEFSFVEINKIVDTMMGFVITYQEKKKIVIKNIMADNFEDVPSIINKMFHSIKFMNSLITEQMSKKNNNLDEILEIKKSIIKLRDYCQRIIQISNYGEDKSHEYYVIVFLIEKIASNFKDLAENGKKNYPDKIKEYDAMLSNLQSAIMKKDFKLAVSMNKELSKIKKHNEEEFAVLLANIFSLSSRILGIIL